MCTWTHKLNRFLTLLRAYLGASLAAGFVIALTIIMPAVLLKVLGTERWSDAALTIPAAVLVVWSIVSLFVAVLALVPALLVVTFAEAVRERRASFYGWAGVMTAGVAVAPLVLASTNLSSWPVDQAILAAIFAIVLALAGLVGGRVFRNLAAPKAGEGCGAITQP